MGSRWEITVLFVTRTVRMIGYGATGVVLALYLAAVGLSDQQIGLLLTLTLLGDSAISLGVTRWADGFGRRRMFTASCLLMVLAGGVYGLVPHPSFALLLAAATVGVLSPSGNEVGPFMALEQSILAELVGPAARTHVFAWYGLVGYGMTAVGALAAGHALTWAEAEYGVSELEGYRAVFLQYGVSGGALLLLFLLLTEQVERPSRRRLAPAQAASVSAAGDEEEAGLRAPLITEPEEAVAGAADADTAAAVAGLLHHVDDSPVGMTDGGSEECELQAATTAAAIVTAAATATGGDGAKDTTTDTAARGSRAATAAIIAAAIADGKGGSSSSSSSSSNTAIAMSPAAGGLNSLGLSPRSHRIVVQLSLLFSLDSLAGGMVTGTLLAYFFQTKYGVSTAYLGSLLFGANMLAAVSSLASGYAAARFGLVNTMVFTHLPSNVLMLLVPLMPTLGLATTMVFLRYSISQMDVAPRSAYVAGIVRPDERTAAMGVINIAKSLGSAFGPLITGWLADRGLFAWAFYLCGGGKIVYDLLLYFHFAHIKPEH